MREVRELLDAIADCLVPADEFPSASQLGASDYVERRLAELSTPDRQRFEAGLNSLKREVEARYGSSVDSLHEDDLSALVADLEQGRSVLAWPYDSGRWLRQLNDWIAEAVYAAQPSQLGTPEPRAAPLWAMLGYPSRPAATTPAQLATPLSGLDDPYDVIVVGAGVSGSIVAGVLAEGGQRVLVLERGEQVFEKAAKQDHLRNHRLSSLGHNTGPPTPGHPRVHVAADGTVSSVEPHDSRYHNNAMCVGGGGLVYGGMAWRFHPKDFRMASEYGVPSGSSLADWPLGYDDLAPYYARAEREIGVAGGARPPQLPQAAAYPMPAHEGHPGRRALSDGATRLGWSTHGVPLLINSIDRHGRGACVRCSACVGFACPSDAKNGGHNTLLSRGLESGNATLVTNAIVIGLEADAQGSVTGVRAILDATAPGNEARRTLRARHVVVACGAIESARLLLASKTPREPRGIGNDSDQVGRHLQGHVYATATGLLPTPVEAFRGPGPSVATSEFVHGNPGIVGGGLLADDFVLLPILAYRDHLPPGVPRWGREAKRFMREGFRRLLKVTGPVQEIPSPESRVTLDPNVLDRHGSPVARLSGTVHSETIRSAEFLRRRASEWLEASGALQVWGQPFSAADFLSAGQHQAGTCRMGDDPHHSVTDPFGRVHGHRNLSVIDASVHVTNGAYNPVLTVMALAFRNAEALLRHLAS